MIKQAILIPGGFFVNGLLNFKSVYKGTKKMISPSFALTQKKQKVKADNKFLEIYACFRPRDPSRPGNVHYLLPGLEGRLLGPPLQKLA
jgi:hypothetical protein